MKWGTKMLPRKLVGHLSRGILTTDWDKKKSILK